MTDLLTDIDTERPRSPVEFRSVPEFEVRWKDRTIEMIAVPYGIISNAVAHHGRAIREVTMPGAYEGVERRANRVKLNRDHDKQRTCGRAIGLHPSRTEGLVVEVRVARTPLGDETLALADDQALEPSVGFAVIPGGETWLEQRSLRRIDRAFLDHIAMVPEGAYYPEGQVPVLAVRQANPPVGSEPRAPTPNLDLVLSWLQTEGR
jgi:phage head maturation protease